MTDLDDRIHDEEREKKLAEKPGPLAWFARNSVAANLIMLSLLVGGLIMSCRVKQEVFPEVQMEMVLVNVPYPGASPAEVEEGVVLPIEEAVRGLDGVKTVRGTAQESFGTVVVELEFGTNKDRALNDVKSAVDAIANFPAEIERPRVFLATNRFQVISLVLYGDQEEAVLRKLAEEVREDLLKKDNITQVELSGVRAPEISIEVSQETLREHGLTLDRIAGVIRQAATEMPGGGVKTSSGEVLLRTNERARTGEDFERIVLLATPEGTEMRVGDIADVRDAFQDSDIEAYFFGQRAVMVNIFRVGDQKPIDIAETVKSYVEEKQESLPPGVSLATWFDTSEIYADRINLLTKNAAFGLILVLLTLGLFLEIRLAFWVTLGIPVSFIGSMLFLPAAGISINMISLFAFIVVLGMVVDDAIVIGEAIYRRRQLGMSRMAAAISGVREVAVPVTFAIITTVVAFSPMLFVPGVSGEFFKNIPVVVILVLLLSLSEGLLVLPAHLAHSRPPSERGFLGWIHHQQQKFSRGVEWLIDHTYVPFLRRVLHRRYLTMAAGFAILLATLGLWVGGRVEFTFMPKIDGDVITADVELPYGASPEQTRIAMRQLEQAANQAMQAHGGREDVRGMVAMLGVGGMARMGPRGGESSSGSHLASVMVYLVPPDDRDYSSRQFAAAWRKAVGEIPGARSVMFSFATGASPGRPIDIALSHPKSDVLEAAAADLAARLADYQGVHDIDDGLARGKPQLQLDLTPEGRSAGLTELELGRQVRNAFFGAEAVRMQRGRDEVRVYVRYPESQRRSEYDIEQLVVQTPNGGEMMLGQAAEVRRGRSYTSIRRRDGRRVIQVAADVDETVSNANKVMASLNRDVLPKLLDRYPGLTFSLEGEQREQGEILSSLGIGFLIALILMYGLLAVVFKHYMQPLIVMSVIPFGLVGAILGHVLMGFELSLMSMMGIVALSGVVVNDSLILVVATNEYRERGMSLSEAVIAGGARRFRPILLTSLTTFLGLTPMILETSVQARFLIPMALSLGFGVLFATFITLVLVPASYLVLEDLKRGFVAIFDFFRHILTGRPSRTEPQG